MLGPGVLRLAFGVGIKLLGAKVRVGSLELDAFPLVAATTFTDFDVSTLAFLGDSDLGESAFAGADAATTGSGFLAAASSTLGESLTSELPKSRKYSDFFKPNNPAKKRKYRRRNS
jgi:hypothetical protein